MLYYQPFSAATWEDTGAGGTVTFNGDGSVRLQDVGGSQARIRYLPATLANGGLPFENGSNEWFVGFHGQSVASGLIRFYLRTLLDNSYALLTYPGDDPNFLTEIDSGLSLTQGGVSNWELFTEQLDSDVTIQAWSIFNNFDLITIRDLLEAQNNQPIAATTPGGSDFYEEMQLFANEMIGGDCFNPNNVKNLWVKHGNRIVANPAEPWRTTTNEGADVQYEVDIVYLPDELEDRQYNMFRKGATTPKGEVNGFMPFYSEFEPTLEDRVRRPLGDGAVGYEDLVLTFVNPIRPQGTTVMYYLEFRR